MNAVITLLASFVIAVFFIGPSLVARFAIERLVVKQPAKAQTSTEELARSFFFSLPLVALAAVFVWLMYRSQYVFEPSTLDSVFAADSTFVERCAAMPGLWPVRSVLLWTYIEVLAYIFVVKLAAYCLSRVPSSNRKMSWNYLCRSITSPYLRSEWDVIAGKLLLRPGTTVRADVATKSGKIFLGTLTGVVTNADGSLRHMQLTELSIRAKQASGSEDVGAALEDYVFQGSSYFVVLASDITDVNLRFERPGTVEPERSHTPVPASMPSEPGKSQVLREHPLEEALTGLDEQERQRFIAQLESRTDTNIQSDDE